MELVAANNTIDSCSCRRTGTQQVPCKDREEEQRKNETG